jgi:hypothetical protein
MKHTKQLLAVGAVISLIASSSCHNSQETKVSYEPQETVVVRAEPAGDSPLTLDSSEEKPEAAPLLSQPETPVAAESSEDAAAERTQGVREIVLGKRFKVTIPRHWVNKIPAVTFIEHEFTVPSTVEGEPDARITFMAAGGGVKANIERWIRQFRLPPGQDRNQAVVQKQLDIIGQKVHIVDVSGTYLEAVGAMMERVIERNAYRMLGAIIECDDGFLYFVKLYGPEKTVAENESAFHAMINSLQVVGSK